MTSHSTSDILITKAKIWNPPQAAQPIARYSLCAFYGPHFSTLEIAGQVGIDEDGNVPDDMTRQTELAWQNLIHILHAHHMDYDDIVALQVNLISRDDLPAYRAAKLPFLKGPPRPATLIFVAGLFDPRWKVEIEARAAKVLSQDELLSLR